MTVSNDISLLIDNYRYEVQFADYSDDEWTAPVILTHSRARRIIGDASVRKVRFTPIISAAPGSNFTFEGRSLVMSHV